MSDLAWAVKNGDMDQVKELVDSKVEYNNITKSHHQPALSIVVGD